MPDGKIVPKPAQISYQYLPPQNGQQQNNNQRGPKVGRDSLQSSNYQVVAAPPSSYAPQPPKQKKTAQNGMSGSSGTRRPSGSNIPKNNKNQPQQQQQYQNAKYMQQQNVQTVPNMHTQNQKNPTNQQQMIANQPNNDAYKQNVLNFINFASHLGAQMVSQQAQKPQMQSTDVMYGTKEGQKSYENYAYQGPSSGQYPTDINMYLQSQAQTNSAQHTHQVQQQAAQPTNYNNPQVQNQVMAAPMNFQYGQSNTRPQIQGGQQQSSVQNQATVFQQNFGNAVQFPGSQNNPVSTNSYSQASQQTLPQNYVIVSSPQESTANTRPLSNMNFDPQSQMMKNIFNTQAQIETPSYDANAQIKHQNFGNQNQESQTYITPDGQQISFVNTAQHSPVTYSMQQNIQQQQIDNQNASPTVQTGYGQPGDQKVYVSYQNPQDLSASYAQSNTASATQAGQQNEQTQYRNIQPQSLLTSVQNPYAGQLAGQSNGQQVAYRVQSQASAGSQSTEPASAYSYVNEQPSYLSTGQKQDSSSGGGKLIYATSSAKQIHYSSSGQGYATPQLKNNEELPSPYAQFSGSSSSYKFDSEDDDDAEYTKQSSSGQLADKQQAKEDNDEDSDEEGDEETSYKVVYIPLDILKNILNNNSVENQRSDKAS